MGYPALGDYPTSYKKALTVNFYKLIKTFLLLIREREHSYKDFCFEEGDVSDNKWRENAWHLDDNHQICFAIARSHHQEITADILGNCTKDTT